MFALVVTCVVIAAALVLVVYVVHAVKPKRVKLRAGVWKIITLDFEADASVQPKELPTSEGSSGKETSATRPDA